MKGKMKGYSINITDGMTAKERILLRKNNLKVTSMLWIAIGWEVDLNMIGGIYERKTAILIWLN